MVGFGRFGILADGRPITLGGRVFDVLMALVEGSGAVVGKTSSRAASGRRIVDQDRQSGTILPRGKGFSVDRKLIPMFADGLPVHQRDPRVLWVVRAGRSPPRRLRTSRAATPANRPPGSVSELIGEGAIGRHACRGQADRLANVRYCPPRTSRPRNPAGPSSWHGPNWCRVAAVQPIQHLYNAANGHVRQAGGDSRLKLRCRGCSGVGEK